MDKFKGKRISGPIMPEKTRRLVLHENMKKKDDKSFSMCSRIGCSSRIDSTKPAFIDYKSKSTVSSFRSPSNGKETVGSSSRSMSGVYGTSKVSRVTSRRQLSSLLVTDSSESSNAHDKSPTTLPRGETKESSISSVCAEVVTKSGSSSRNIHKRPDLVTREARMVNNWQNSRASVNRQGLRDLRSKSGSDIPAVNPNSTRRSNIFRMKNSDGESSSSNKEIKTDRSVTEVRNKRYPHGNGVTMSESTRNRNLQMELVVLENNLNGVSIFHDQHRDMRLDIDNMSYEELLALGEKIGTVSTALSEESLLKSLKSSIYRPRDKLGGLSLNKEDDVKCSICQEEYVDEDEVGTLPCRHMYHVSCVQQWLRLKNWCPICKTSAEPKSRSFSMMRDLFYSLLSFLFSL